MSCRWQATLTIEDDAYTLDAGTGDALTAGMDMAVSVTSGAVLQDKTVTPGSIAQTVVSDPGYDGLSSVTVEPIPNNYGLITWDGSTLTVS